MLETKEQKQIFAGSLGLIVLLLAVSIWNKPKVAVENKPPLANQNQDFNQDILSSKAYLDYYLASNIDRQASKELFETLITKEEVKQEVEKELQVNQKIVPPKVDDKKIKTISDNSSLSVEQYLKLSVSDAYAFNANSLELNNGIYSGDMGTVDELKSRLENLTNKLYDTEVPSEALVMHKALITAYLSYTDLLNSSRDFNPDSDDQKETVWPEAYKNYAIANDNTKLYSNELNKLASKYKISYIQVNHYAQEEKQEKKTLVNLFIPQAHALFGVADFTFNTTIGDIPALILDGIKQGLATAFVKFTGTMLNKFVAKIQSTFGIANFLFYNDALVDQYGDDYLSKYVTDNLDKSIVKKFLPHLNCGKNPDLKALFQTKSNSYLGFDPNNLDPRDPDYYQKLAKVGNFMASPQGWKAYYEGIAVQTQSQSQKSAELELTSSGLKAAKAATSTQAVIKIGVNTIVSSEQAALKSIFELGGNNAQSFVSKLAASITETMINKFVFAGITGTNGSIGVLKEQTSCISGLVKDPILPVPTTLYEEPPPPPTQQALLADECAPTSEIRMNCTDAILGEVTLCAKNSSKRTGKLSCDELAGSRYLQALQEKCAEEALRPAPLPGEPEEETTEDCSGLQAFNSGTYSAPNPNPGPNPTPSFNPNPNPGPSPTPGGPTVWTPQLEAAYTRYDDLIAVRESRPGGEWTDADYASGLAAEFASTLNPLGYAYNAGLLCSLNNRFVPLGTPGAICLNPNSNSDPNPSSNDF